MFYPGWLVLKWGSWNGGISMIQPPSQTHFFRATEGSKKAMRKKVRAALTKRKDSTWRIGTWYGLDVKCRIWFGIWQKLNIYIYIHMVYDIWYMIYEIWYMTWNIKNIKNDIWYMIYYIWYIVYDIWYLYTIWYDMIWFYMICYVMCYI
jgi:hypothetical protein